MLTNEQISQFKIDAIADGWNIEPTFPNHESVDWAASLSRDGYRMMILTRPTRPNFPKPYFTIYIWGPDGLCIDAPSIYSMQAIIDGVTKCQECGKTGVKTQRVGFAGRVCAECLPSARKKYEHPGWDN